MTGRRAIGLWWGTLVLLALSALMNVAQASRLRAAMAPKPSSLIGRSVRPLHAVDRDGQTAVIRFDRNVPTVLYFFSPTCGWCERNWDNVQRLAGQAEGRYRVVGVAAETTLAEVIDRQHLAFEIYGGLSTETREALSFVGTPRTVVVSAQGLITHDWTGAFTGSVALAVEDVFGLSLPGLRPSVTQAKAPGTE